MKISGIACIVCILSGALQLAISAEVLADGGTVTFQYFLTTGTIAVIVGVAGLLFVRRTERSHSAEYAIALLTLATGILTIVLAFYANIGYGSA